MVALTRRSRLYRRFYPIIDGLVDKARRNAEQVEEEFSERDWNTGGWWQKSHSFSHDLEIAESMSGNPLTTLARAVDSVHRRELICVVLVGVDCHGVIHSAWSDGDLPTMSKAARFLADDLKQAADGSPA